MRVWYILDSDGDKPVGVVKGCGFSEAERRARNAYGDHVIVVDKDFHDLTERIRKSKEKKRHVVASC